MKSLVARSTSQKDMQSKMDVKQERIQMKKDHHIKTFKDECKSLFLALQIRINTYSLIVGISKEGL